MRTMLEITLLTGELLWVKQTNGNFNSVPKGNSIAISKKLFTKWNYIIRQLN